MSRRAILTMPETGSPPSWIPSPGPSRGARPPLRWHERRDEPAGDRWSPSTGRWRIPRSTSSRCATPRPARAEPITSSHSCSARTRPPAVSPGSPARPRNFGFKRGGRQGGPAGSRSAPDGDAAISTSESAHRVSSCRREPGAAYHQCLPVGRDIA